MSLPCGMIVDHYIIIEAKSLSTLPSVYLAQDQSTEKPVLIKTYFEGIETSDSFRAEFSSLAEQLTALDHPNLEKILEYGLLEQGVYLICDYYVARQLSDLVKTPISVKEASNWLSQVVDGLAYLQSKGLAHGDLTQQNILVQDNNEVRLKGFGLYSLLGREMVWGMPRSMTFLGLGDLVLKAPEQIAGREPNFRSDIYSLGAVFFELITGERPFKSSTIIESCLRKTDLPLGWPAKLPVKVSGTAVRFIHRCVAKKPEQRFSSIKDVMKVIRRLSAGRPAYIRVNREIMFGRPKTPSFFLFGLVSFLLLMSLGGIGYYQIKYMPDRRSAKAEVLQLAPTFTLTSTPTVTHTPIFTITPTPRPSLTATQKPTYQVKLNTANISHIKFLSEQNLSSSFNTGRELNSVALAGARANLVFSPNGHYLAASGLSYKTVIMDSANLEILSTYAARIPPGQPFSPNSDMIAIVMENIVKLKLGKNDLKGEFLHISKLPSFSSDQILGEFVVNGEIQFVNNGSLVVAGRDNMTKVWDVMSGLDVEIIEGGEFGCQVGRAKHDKEFITASSQAGMINVWDELAQHICSYTSGFNKKIASLSNDGSLLAYTNIHGLVELYDTQNKTVLWRSPLENKDRMTTLDFSSDGTILAVGTSQGKLNFYTTASGNLIHNIDVSKNEIKNVQFSPDDKLVALMTSTWTVYEYAAYATE